MKKIFKRVSAAVMALAVMMTAVVFDVPWKTTAAAAVGNISLDFYHLDDDGKLTIKNDYGMEKWVEKSANYATDVKTVEIQSPVTSIPAQAFRNCTNLSSVEVGIGSKVQTIGDYAFNNCSRLHAITIPDSVTSIGSSAFAGCIELSSITIPAAVTSIASSAFGNCNLLTEINVAADNAAYSSADGVLLDKNQKKLIFCPRGKQGSYEIPSTVESIEQSAFNQCKKLTSVTAAEGSKLTTIYRDAFLYCSALESITIPEGVTSLWLDVFVGCTKLKSINIPASLTSISINNVGGSPFRSCSLLTAITVEADNPNYSSADGVLFDKNKTKLICCPGGKQGSYEIPGTVTSIEIGAFYDCKNLTSVTIPNTVTSIDTNTFYNCTGLKSVTIPDTVTSIGINAFYRCGLTSVTIPSRVTSIGNYAFQNCSALTSVTIPKTVTSIGNGAFGGCTNLSEIVYPSAATVGSNAFYRNTTQVKYTVTDDKLNVTEITLGTGKTSVTITNAMGISFVDEAHRSNVSQEGHTHIYEDLSGTATDACVICNKAAVKHIHGICGDPTCTEHEEITDWTPISDASGFSNLETGKHYYLTGPVTLTDEVTIGENTDITLCLNGQTLTAAENKRFFTVKGSLTLCDCDGGGTLTGGKGSGNGGAVYVNGGNFTMYGGTISDSTARNAGVSGGTGGGVYVDKNSKFIMSGGTISNNTASSGGGVYVFQGGTFEMSGGTISNNTASSGSGGGVFVNGVGTKFTMSGGTISNNTASSSGGGVYVTMGTFEMSGNSTISGNTASKNGGGVYVGSDGGSTFIMHSGTISNNTAVNGGGVFVGRNFTIDGKVDISGNKKTDNSVNNVYLNSKTITIGSDFSTESVIGITNVTAPTSCSATKTGAVDIATNITNNITGSFKPDVDGQTFVYYNGKVKLTLVHNCSNSWTSDSTGHWHACDNCDEKIDFVNHTLEQRTDDTNHWQVCTVCNYESTKSAHTWGNWKIIQAPTAAATGTAKGTCTEEGCTATQTKTLPEIDLSGSGSDPEGLTIETKRPTMTEGGEIKYKDESGNVVTTVEIPALNAASGGASVWTKAEVGEGADKSKNPTPTAGGTFVYTSTDYGTVTFDVPALTDTDFWTKTETKKPEIDKVGEYTYESDYGAVTVEVPALTDDTWEKTATTKPSVSTGGKYTCTSDYGTVTVDVPALTDKEFWTKTETKKPEIDKVGEYTYESDYGAVTVEVPALTDDTWEKTATTKPSVSTGGKYTCTSDYGTVTVDVPALTDKEFWTKTETKKPEIDKSGEYTYESDYGAVTVEVPALTDTDFWTKKITGNTDPGADTTGSYTYTSTYGEVTVEVPALNDDTVWTKDDTQHVDATEKDDGKDVYTSPDYGEVTVVLPALGHIHEWGDWEITKAPDKDEEGTAKRVCAKNNAHTETKTLPVLTDTSVWTKDNNQHVDPTEDNNGKDVYTSEYGEVIIVLPALGHNEPTDPDSGNISVDVQPGENAPDTELKTPFEDLADAVLTPDEQENIKNGVDIKIILIVSDVTESVPADDRAKAEAAIRGLSGYKLGQYLDLNLLKIIEDRSEKISKTNAPITVMFTIPEALRAESRVYSVIRVHNGKTDVLNDLDSDINTVTIETDRFSTYTLVYSEKTVPPQEDNTENNSGESGSDNGGSDSGEDEKNPSEGGHGSNEGVTAPSEGGHNSGGGDTVPGENVTASGEGGNNTVSGGHNSSEAGVQDKSDSSPDTGDNSIPMGRLIIIILAAAGVLFIAAGRKKQY